jgi:hypothetical protein
MPPFFRNVLIPLIVVKPSPPVLRGAKGVCMDSLPRTERTLLMGFLWGNSRACSFGLFVMLSGGLRNGGTLSSLCRGEAS